MRSKSFKTRDEQEVAGYIEMLERIFENCSDIPVTENNTGQPALGDGLWVEMPACRNSLRLIEPARRQKWPG